MKEWIFEPQRLQRLAAIFICAYFLSLAIKLGIDPAYLHVNPGDYPIDFSWIWAAGRAVASGNGGQVYNFDYFSTAQIETFGAQIKRFPYVYPPTLLLYLAPLGLFPIFTAMVLWLFATFAAAWAALRRIAPAAMLTLLGTAPAAAAWTFQLGHTGFLGTALIGFALALIPESPFTGGLVLGLLTYKPQLGVIFPIVLLASRQWHVLLGATASTVALVAVTAFDRNRDPIRPGNPTGLSFRRRFDAAGSADGLEIIKSS